MQQQEPAVQQINQGAEETHRNVEQANTKLDSAIQSAKNARRWKWYALIIVSKLFVYIAYTIVAELPANPTQSLSSPLSSVWPSVSPKPTSPRTRTDQTLYDPRRGNHASSLLLFLHFSLVTPRCSTTLSHFLLSCVKAMTFQSSFLCVSASQLCALYSSAQRP